ncbi:hypothetical protein FRX31_006312 [Thalictrum thalictroides]|uniref:Dof-type domain-containing protein n=1 Tax=Thalictrum thalictroides TaxID=46969 RepID=A0A7J6X6A1_THATH|nr:hypothetical protein FRX31_006312 [Thalictrum thalictroides]
MEGKRQIEQQDMRAMENLQQFPPQQQLVEVQTHPPRRCSRCKGWETMFGYYNIFRDSQPRYRCKICSHYWSQGEVPRGKRKNNQHSEAASSSTNRVCKIPRSVGNVFPTSSSDVRINRQHDPLSRILAADGNASSNLSSSIRINEPRTLDVSVSGKVNRHLYPHGLCELPQQQQHFCNSQNFGWNGADNSVHQVSSVQQNPVPAVLPSITPSMLPLCFSNGNNASGLEAVSWDRNTMQNHNYIIEVQAQVTLLLRSTTVLQFQPSLYNIGSVSNPEAQLWSNNNNIAHQVTPFTHATTVPDSQQIFFNAGGASDAEENLLNNHNSDGVNGIPVNPFCWPDQPNF